jgi:penicillin-binding protein 1A
VGPESVVDLAGKLGVTSELPAVNSLVLGTGDVSVLDMATGFSTFANRGIHNAPTLLAKIEQVDEEGHLSVVEQHTPSGEQVLTEQEADLVTHCLRQVVQAGTGRAADIGRPAAGKTGTTQDNRDAWFVGYTPKLTAAVWMGYPGAPGVDPRFMDDVHGIEVTGGSFPAQIWAKFMRAATKDMDTGSFKTPTSFPGRELHPELELPTSSTSSTSSTTLPESSTSTTTGSSTTAPSTTAPSTTVPSTTNSSSTTVAGGGGPGAPPN